MATKTVGNVGLSTTPNASATIELGCVYSRASANQDSGTPYFRLLLDTVEKMARKTFFSFHYKPDNWRAATVRSIGSIDGNKPATDNNWEAVTNGGDAAIEKWIADQMSGRSCTVVLVGANTANRKWINYEIIKSWNDGMGVVGIRIHGLKDSVGNISTQGSIPFDHIGYGNTGRKLSEIVKCYNPAGGSSQERYAWIKNHLSNAVEEAISIRKDN